MTTTVDLAEFAAPKRDRWGTSTYRPARRWETEGVHTGVHAGENVG